MLRDVRVVRRSKSRRRELLLEALGGHLHGELRGVFPARPITPNGRHDRCDILSGDDDNVSPLRGGLHVGMVLLVFRLGPHEGMCEGMLLPTAQCSRADLGPARRLDEHLPLRMCLGTAPAASAAPHDLHEQLDVHQHVHLDKHFDLHQHLHLDHHKHDDLDEYQHDNVQHLHHEQLDVHQHVHVHEYLNVNIDLDIDQYEHLDLDEYQHDNVHYQQQHEYDDRGTGQLCKLLRL